MMIREGDIVRYHFWHVHPMADPTSQLSEIRTRTAIVGVIRESGSLGLHVLFIPGDTVRPENEIDYISDGEVRFIDHVGMAIDVGPGAGPSGHTWSRRDT
jgi:hypothetical protein